MSLATFSKNSTAHTSPVHHTTSIQLATSTHSTNKKENGNGEVWLQYYTPSTFSKVHPQIQPLIEDISQKPEYQSHTFQAK
jgi:hypothetical protein